jgi:hypothetical protein
VAYLSIYLTFLPFLLISNCQIQSRYANKALLLVEQVTDVSISPLEGTEEGRL